MVKIWKKILEQIGMNPERLQIEWVSASEGVRFTQIITDFTRRLKELGPLWEGTTQDLTRLKLKLEAAKNLAPYMKLVESNKFQQTLDQRQMSNLDFFIDNENEKIFDELIKDKLVMCQVLMLLKEQFFSIKELSGFFGLDSCEISRCLMLAAKKGLIRWETAGFKTA
jgi:F420-non-reducing hydrogenase iron-sulfur subunit